MLIVKKMIQAKIALQSECIFLLILQYIEVVLRFLPALSVFFHLHRISRKNKIFKLRTAGTHYREYIKLVVLC